MCRNAQPAIAGIEDIEKCKAMYSKALRAFHSCRDSNGPTARQVELFHDCRNAGTAFFNSVENCIANSALLGAYTSEFWAADLANTATNVLDFVLDYYEKEMWPEADRLHLDRLQPSPNAYSAMQNAVLVYNSDQAQLFQKRFTTLGLPIRGFTNPVPMNTYRTWEKMAMLGIVIVFLGALLAVGVCTSTFTPQGFFIIRVILALFSAAFTAIAIPGFLEVSFKLKKSALIRATGAIAVFIVVYLLNPPSVWPPKSNDSSLSKEGTNTSAHLH
jgi:hypothetical protein